MSDYKEIQLTEDDIEQLGDAIFMYDVYEALINGEQITLIPPKHKVIKLKDLPDGTVICDGDSDRRMFINNNKLYTLKNAHNSYCNETTIFNFPKLIQGPKTVWEGGECPVPDGVNITVGLRNGGVSTDVDRPTLMAWCHSKGQNDIIWYQIIRAADGYAVEG